MKIKKLTIHNIASIADAEIDFQGDILANEPLFLITGDTGSGKTTILDAICLALYKNTPRTVADSKEANILYKESNGNTTKEESISTGSTKLLMKRNTAEAYSILEFEDSQGTSYIARWNVARAYKKTTGKIQKAEHSLYNCTTGQTLVKDKDVENAVITAVGMNFEQFCRTCMLSQGDFTRFLKSKENEKSEILEKLTGTEIYSRIGKNIFEIAKQKDIVLSNKRASLQGIQLLGEEEKSRIEQIINENNLLLNKNNELLSLAEKKLSYLQKRISLEEDRKQKENLLNTYINFFNSEEYLQQSNSVKLFDATVQLRSSLKELNAYSAEMERQKKESVIYKNKFLTLNAGLQYLINETNRLNEQYKSLDDDIVSLQKELESKTKEQQAYDYNSLNKEYNHIVQKKDRVLQLCRIIGQIDFYNNKLQENTLLYNQLYAAYTDAKTSYDKISDSVNDRLKAVRMKLNAGDICPLCGQKIQTVFSDAEFEKIALPLKEKTDKIKKQLDEAALEKKNSASLLVRLQNEKNSILKDGGFSYKEPLTTAFLQNESGVLQNRSELLAERIRQINQLNQHITELQSRNNKLLSVKHSRQTALLVINSCLDAKNSIKEETKKWEEENIAPCKVDNLQNEWNNLRGKFLEWKNKIMLLRENISQRQQFADSFFKENPQITQQCVNSLEGYTEKTVNDIRKQHEEMKSKTNILRGAIEQINEDIKANEKHSSLIEEGETLDTLQIKIKEIKETLLQLQQSTGANKEKLSLNAKNTELYTKALQETEVLQEEARKWKDLSAYFGSADGRLFRSIAQSFILGDLLDKANYFLRRFSDRFELSCQDSSLTILIKDKYEGGLLTSSAGLSGGESFMVSLSLALGLARMNTGNSFSDILFIDEGFGTLSGECLNTVMDTLEKLHNIGGRRVGIISHVSELKEKISAQIQVKRLDTTKSTVEIVRI